MPQNDYNAGRAAGVAEGHRKATLSRRWMDVVIMVLIAAAVVVITQTQQRSTERLIRNTDQKTNETNRNSYIGCEQRNKIVLRQIKYYEDNARILSSSRSTLRNPLTKNNLDTAEDIRALGVRDCSVYLKNASPAPSPK